MITHLCGNGRPCQIKNEKKRITTLPKDGNGTIQQVDTETSSNKQVRK